MARQTNIQLSLTTNGLIFYQRNGVGYIRTCPTTVQQTKATKKAAQIFGEAATLGRSVRQQLQHILPNPTDREMQNKLRSALHACLLQKATDTNLVNNTYYLHELELNSLSLLQQLLQTKLTINHTNESVIHLHIPSMVPAQHIKAPAHTQFVQWQIMAVACNIHHPNEVSNYSHLLEMPYTNDTMAAQNIGLPLATTPDSLIIVAVSLGFKTSETSAIHPNIKWRPIMIV